MRKRIFGRRFKRDRNERKALFAGLMRSFILHGRIQTSEAKAKSIKGKVEKLVTKAIRQKEDAAHVLLRHFDRDIVQKLISDIAPRFTERPGGYTRIIRLGKRVKDNASMVILEWVEGEIKDQISKIKNEGQENKKDKQLEKKASEVKVATKKESEKKSPAKKEGKKDAKNTSNSSRAKK